MRDQILNAMTNEMEPRSTCISLFIGGKSSGTSLKDVQSGSQATFREFEDEDADGNT